MLKQGQSRGSPVPRLVSSAKCRVPERFRTLHCLTRGQSKPVFWGGLAGTLRTVVKNKSDKKGRKETKGRPYLFRTSPKAAAAGFRQKNTTEQQGRKTKRARFHREIRPLPNNLPGRTRVLALAACSGLAPKKALCSCAGISVHSKHSRITRRAHLRCRRKRKAWPNGFDAVQWVAGRIRGERRRSERSRSCRPCGNISHQSLARHLFWAFLVRLQFCNYNESRWSACRA